jgi:hypothetical protein
MTCRLIVTEVLELDYDVLIDSYRSFGVGL